ncbi:MAG TPA: YciI family protein [Polyangia bacterium]|nr:YciI family protein [Polyangia bacterium]
MKYALLCYNAEEIVGSWSPHEDQSVMAKLGVINDRLIRENKMGPVARLMPSTAARTLRKAGTGRRLEASDRPPMVVDGPFAETKEQLLGFFVVECADLDEALAIARELGEANPGGAYEVRPIAFYLPGAPLA